MLKPLLCLSALLLCLPAAAQEAWPSKPIRLIVGFAAGSGNDVAARLVAPKMAEALGQQVVVENRTGAGGVIGTEAVAKAAPDGYTIGLGTSSQLVMNPALVATLPFDIDRDLTMIGLIARTPLLLVARKDVPGGDLAGLIAYAKANPGKINYGSGGNGSISHIVPEHFAREAGIQLTHIPYRGNAPALADVVAGQIDFLFDGFVTSGPLHKEGKARILAVHGPRNPDYPDVPSFSEFPGLANFESYTWNGLFAPRGTPAPVLDRLNRELNKALVDPTVKQRFDSFGAEMLTGSSAAEADAFAKAQRARWVPAVRAMNIKVE